MTIDEYRVMLFKQSLPTLDDSQLVWIIEKDYPEEQQALAREELKRRGIEHASAGQDHRRASGMGEEGR